MRLPERFLDWRNRLVGNPGFQRFAARFPLTRPVAEAEARAVFDLCAGFVYSQVLLAVVELRLLEALRDGPERPAALSDRCGLPPEAMLRLLKAAAALGLVAERPGAAYGLGMRGASLLANPGAMRMIEHHRVLYQDIADPVRLLRGERRADGLGSFWAYAGGTTPDAASAASYSELMAQSLSLLLEDVLAAYPFARHRAMLDIGGGTGGFARAVAHIAPETAVTVVDLPGVIAVAREGGAAGGRVRFVAGDAIAGPLPAGADLVTLVRILHDHDDAAALGILRSIHDAIAPGGTVLIAEPMSGPPGTAAMADAYFGFYLLAMGAGRARSPQEYRAMLTTAGFAGFRQLRLPRPLLASAVVARRAR